jgi:hypothetical protein
VPFEECRTPVQLINSELNTIWPIGINDRTYARLGGPKEIVTLEGMDQWSLSTEFAAAYAGHVLRWFNSVDAAAPKAAAEALA